MKLLFIGGTLGGGGAEKRLVHLMNYFVAKNIDVRLILFYNKGTYKSFLDRKVKVHVIGKIRLLATLYRILFVARLYFIYSPDIIFTNLRGTNKIALLGNLLFFNHFKMIISIVNNPDAHNLHINNEIKSKFNDTIILNKLYKRSNLIITNSRGLNDCVIKTLNVNKNKCKYIYNGIDIKNIIKLSKVSNPLIDNENVEYSICSVGSLFKKKGFDVLLKAISLVVKQKNIKLYIIGMGSQLDALKKMTVSLNITNYVSFMGFQRNPYKWIKNSDLFILSSYYEGFPNVILEAMVCKTPVISTRAQYGPEEIINNGVNGVLVPTGEYKKLADEIINIFNNRYDVATMVDNAYSNVIQNYSLDKMCSKYEYYFRRIKNIK